MDMDDRTGIALLTALRFALADTGEHRLYKSGKLDGLFPSRSGRLATPPPSAARGISRTVRNEVKGKISIEWVRLDGQGSRIHLSARFPAKLLEEMRRLMQDARSGVPNWLNATLDQLQMLSQTFGDEMQRYLQRSMHCRAGWRKPCGASTPACQR